MNILDPQQREMVRTLRDMRENLQVYIEPQLKKQYPNFAEKGLKSDFKTLFLLAGDLSNNMDRLLDKITRPSQITDTTKNHNTQSA